MGEDATAICKAVLRHGKHQKLQIAELENINKRMEEDKNRLKEEKDYWQSRYETENTEHTKAKCREVSVSVTYI